MICIRKNMLANLNIASINIRLIYISSDYSLVYIQTRVYIHKLGRQKACDV